MRLIFIRHAEPDYKNNTLTEKGFREAAILAERTASWENVREAYVSPLARAQLTAAPCLEKLRLSAFTYDWLQEFLYPVWNPETGVLFQRTRVLFPHRLARHAVDPFQSGHRPGLQGDL